MEFSESYAFLDTKGLYGNDPEALKELQKRKQCVKNLETQVKTLLMFSKYADLLNRFDAFYDEEKYRDEDFDNTFKETQKKEIETLDQAKEFLKTGSGNTFSDNKVLREAFEEQIRTIEDKICDEDQIREFYKELDTDHPPAPEHMASKCNDFVQQLKSRAAWLHAVDPDFKDSSPAPGVHKDGGRFWRVQSENFLHYRKTNSKNNVIETQLKAYFQDHPEGHIEYYRGIPYIAENGSKEPLIIPNADAH